MRAVHVHIHIIYLSIHLSTTLSIYLSIYLYISIYIYMKYLGREVLDEVLVEAEGGERRAGSDGGGEREQAVVVQDQLPQRVEPPDLHR